MAITTTLKSSKLGMLHFLSKISGGKHTKLKKFKAAYATEVVIEPSSHTYYNIDGEIYENDTAYVKLLPGFLNLMGTTVKVDKVHQSFKDTL